MARDFSGFTRLLENGLKKKMSEIIMIFQSILFSPLKKYMCCIYSYVCVYIHICIYICMKFMCKADLQRE